ncbi:MAG: flagellar biosynthetic protein FliO [Phycisphaerales bacterium]
MARRFAHILSSLAVLVSAAVALGQVGPPVDVRADLAGTDLQASTVADPGVTAAPSRPAESDMPLMGASRGASEVPAGSTSSAGGGWTRTLASVALVIGLILVLSAAARFVSRRTGSVAAMLGPGGRAPSGVLEVLARYPVGRGQVLVLLRIDRRVLLLSQSVGGKGAGFATLAQFDDPSEVAAILRQTRDEASESVSARFRQALERFQGDDGGDASIERGEIIEVGPRGEPLQRGRGLWA